MHIESDASLQTELEREVARRRTFAIISHPDAGKTTLTEKLLLYAGAIELAGAVRGRKARKHATSDWMALEQERGISITAAALEFELEGRRMALLDTPGHKDFSEDTYRALIAADSVVMVIDAANGVEGQTRKLFEVCRRHRLPILTFVNKFDRPARDPLELLDDIESTLGISAAPVNWPVGNAEHFRGVYDLQRQHLLLYEREMQGQYRAPVDVSDLDDPDARELIGENTYVHFRESLDVIRVAGTTFDIDAYRAGTQTPVFFGSAMTNFGLEPFLRTLVELAPHPQPRPSDTGIVEPTDERFTGFVFKIQANMDPRHRDRVAFVRVCSGKFTKDMAVSNSRAGKLIRATRAYRFFGRDRETITEAYAGDIIGLVNPGQFAIGDTVHTGAPLRSSSTSRAFRRSTSGRLRLQDHALQAVRRWVAAARGRGADAGVLRRERPPRADRRRRRRAAVRRHHQPPADRVRRRDPGRSLVVHRRAMGRGSRQAAAAPRRRDDGGGGPAGAACAAVRQRVGSAVLREAEPHLRAARRVAGRVTPYDHGAVFRDRDGCFVLRHARPDSRATESVLSLAS